MTVTLKLESVNVTDTLNLEVTDITDLLTLDGDISDDLSVSDGKEIYKEVERYGVTSYENLDNLPSLDGLTIIGDVHEKDPTVPLWAKTDTKPSYTSDEIGISSISIGELEKIWDSL